MSPQQRRIAELVSRGRSNREIAEAPGCSPRTVGNTLGMIYARLGLRSRTELAVLMATTGGKVEPGRDRRPRERR